LEQANTTNAGRSPSSPKALTGNERDQKVKASAIREKKRQKDACAGLCSAQRKEHVWEKVAYDQTNPIEGGRRASGKLDNKRKNASETRENNEGGRAQPGQSERNDKKT